MSTTFTTIAEACVALQTGKCDRPTFLGFAKSAQHDTQPLLKLFVDKVLTMDEINEIISAHKALAAASSRPAMGKLSFKVSDKGVICVCGLGSFPTSLYVEQWDRLVNDNENLEALRTFLKASVNHPHVVAAKAAKAAKKAAPKS